MKLFRYLLIFFVPIIIFVVVANYLAKPFLKEDNAYYLASIDKEKRLAAIASPRIIFMGSSSLPFGVDSRVVEKELNRSVVNMGVTAEFGLPFILNETVSSIRSKDIVVLSPDYYLSDGNKKAQSFLADNNPNAISYLPNSIGDRILYGIYRCQRIASNLFYYRAVKSPVYLRSAFNEYGDNILNYDSTSTYTGAVVGLQPKDYSKEMEQINAFIEKCHRNNAEVYFSYPSCSYSYYKSNKAVMMEFDAIIRKSIQCPVLDSINTYVYPDSYFFDFSEHLNYSGRAVKTKTMVELLKQRLK